MQSLKEAIFIKRVSTCVAQIVFHLYANYYVVRLQYNFKSVSKLYKYYLIAATETNFAFVTTNRHLPYLLSAQISITDETLKL